MKIQCNQCGNEITIATTVKQSAYNAAMAARRQRQDETWSSVDRQFPELTKSDQARETAKILGCSERTAWRVLARNQTLVENGLQDSMSGVLSERQD